MKQVKALSISGVAEMVEGWVAARAFLLRVERGECGHLVSRVRDDVVAKTAAFASSVDAAQDMAAAMEIPDAEVTKVLRRSVWAKRDQCIARIVELVPDDLLLEELLTEGIRDGGEDQADEEFGAALEALGAAGRGGLIDRLIDVFCPKDDEMRAAAKLQAYRVTKDAMRLLALRARAEQQMRLAETSDVQANGDGLVHILMQEEHFTALWEATRDPFDLEQARRSADLRKHIFGQARAWLTLAQATGDPKDLCRAFDLVIRARDHFPRPVAALQRCVEKFIRMSASSFIDFEALTEKEPWSDEVRIAFLADLRTVQPDMATRLEETYDVALQVCKTLSAKAVSHRG